MAGIISLPTARKYAIKPVRRDKQAKHTLPTNKRVSVKTLTKRQKVRALARERAIKRENAKEQIARAIAALKLRKRFEY